MKDLQEIRKAWDDRLSQITEQNLVEIRPEKIIDTVYEITLSRPALPAGDLTICFFSDVHGCVTGREPEQIMKILRKEEPDIVLCGGDNVVADPVFGQKDHREEAAELLNRIAAERDLYLALGNHETRMRADRERFGSAYEDFMQMLHTGNIHVLDNRSEPVMVRDIPVRIYGFTMRAMYYSRLHHVEMPPVELREALGVPDPEELNILMAHNPACCRACMKWGADLTLSGHYHGGVFRIGSHSGIVTPDMRFFCNRVYGQFENKGKHVIITSGAGEHTVPVRIANPREVVTVRLHICQDSD